METKIKQKGFTLIELIVVMTIIAILAGAILVGMDQQRKKARYAQALQTVKSILPYAIECYMKGDINYTDANCHSYAAGAAICSGNIITFPTVPTGCSSWTVCGELYGDASWAASVLADGCSGLYARPRCHFSGTKSGKCEEGPL